MCSASFIRKQQPTYLIFRIDTNHLGNLQTIIAIKLRSSQSKVDYIESTKCWYYVLNKKAKVGFLCFLLRTFTYSRKCLIQLGRTFSIKIISINITLSYKVQCELPN